MVSSLNLAYIHLRLDELFGGDEWFGSRNMLFVGDILQLQPVNKAARKRKQSKSKLCDDGRPKKKLCTCAAATNTPRQQSRKNVAI